MKADIRLCDNCEFEKYFEIVKRHKVGLEFQTFANPSLKNVKKQVRYQKDIAKNIKHKSLHAPFADLNLGKPLLFLRVLLNVLRNASCKSNCLLARARLSTSLRYGYSSLYFAGVTAGNFPVFL